jgi:hypothetical protein
MGFEPDRIAHIDEGARFLGDSYPALIDQVAEILALLMYPFQVVPGFRYLFAH